jgi:hypothetical protein
VIKLLDRDAYEQGFEEERLIGRLQIIVRIIKSNLLLEDELRLPTDAYNEIKDIINKYPSYSNSRLTKRVSFECTYRFYQNDFFKTPNTSMPKKS